MTHAPAVGAGHDPKRDGPSETTIPDAPPRTEAEAESGETREDKERRDREAGDVADDLADFA